MPKLSVRRVQLFDGRVFIAQQNLWDPMINEERKPVLLSPTRSIKIVDLRVRKRNRKNPPKCKYCSRSIETNYALSKGSRTGARYYHIDCAVRVGFGIAV